MLLPNERQRAAYMRHTANTIGNVVEPLRAMTNETLGVCGYYTIRFPGDRYVEYLLTPDAKREVVK